MPITTLAPIAFLALSAQFLNSESSTQQPTQAPPPCVSAPDNAPQSQIDCYNAACKAYQIAWGDCTTTQCRQLAQLEYLAAIIECDLAVMAPPTKFSWITLSWDGTDWSYAFPSTTQSGTPQSGDQNQQRSQNFNF